MFLTFSNSFVPVALKVLSALAGLVRANAVHQEIKRPKADFHGFEAAEAGELSFDRCEGGYSQILKSMWTSTKNENTESA